MFSQTMDSLQKIDGCYSLFLTAASTCLDNDKNIKSENLNAVADLVNSSYSDAGLTAFGVQIIWVEIKEYCKVWNDVIKVVDQDIVDWQSGTIKPKDERDWEMILRVSHHFTLFSVNVAFSLLSFSLTCLFPLCLMFSCLPLFCINVFS